MSQIPPKVETDRQPYLSDEVAIQERLARVDASLAKQLQSSIQNNASLKARIKVLEEALLPFAEIARELVDTLPDEKKNNMLWAVPTVGQLRAALAAILQQEKGNG